MRTFLTITTGLIFSFVSIFAQDCTYYFPVKPGTTMEMKTYNGKDKLTGSSKVTVLNKEGNKITFQSEVFDDKGKSVGKATSQVSCENGEFVMDMKSYLQGVNMDAYKDMNVNFSTKNLMIPANLQPGQKLSDGEVTMSVSNQMGMKIMNMYTKLTNRVVEGKEDVTTPAGTFNCAKINSDVEAKMMMKMKFKMTEWISPNVGTVRTESRDEKGKLNSYTILTSVSNH